MDRSERCAAHNNRVEGFMPQDYDASWDLEESEDGNLPQDESAFNRIYAKWKKRPWEPWLREKLDFPFPVERMEDDDDAYFTDIAESEPFRLGHIMKVVDIGMEDNLYGIIVKVREGRRVGYVPLCDLKVTSTEDDNYWPVREYVVWFANR